MSISQYVRSEKFRRYFSDWVLVGCLFVFFITVAETAKPFNREFSLSDITIQHPFAKVERVSAITCGIIALIMPAIVIVVVSFSFQLRNKRSYNENIHLIQVSLLGLSLAVFINGVLTDILKNWIARPRPDFLDRCGPIKGTDLVNLVGIEVCTAPYGKNVLMDGMRSAPSGHASISFSGLLFLSLWLTGQFKVAHAGTPVYKFLLVATPVLLAVYISLSRTQDYRHHFTDILLGGSIGVLISLLVYHKFFPSVLSTNPERPLAGEDRDEPIIPLYNSATPQ